MCSCTTVCCCLWHCATMPAGEMARDGGLLLLTFFVCGFSCGTRCWLLLCLQEMARAAGLRRLTYFVCSYDLPQHRIPEEGLPPANVITTMRVRGP